MAVDPYIARGVTPLGLGLPELALEMRGQKQRYDLGNRELDQRESYQNAVVGLGQQEFDRESQADADEQDERMAFTLGQSGDWSYAVSKMAERHPEFARLAQQDPQKAIQAAQKGLESKYGKEQKSVGPLSQIVGPDGNPMFATSEQALGQRPYIKPDKPERGPSGAWSPPFQGMGADGKPTLYRQHSLTGEIQPVTVGGGQVAPIPKTTGANGVPTEGERTATNYLGRMEAAEPLLGDYKPSVKDYIAARSVLQGGPIISSAANKALSADGQKYYQAAADWVRAKLRKESGAVISPQEMEQEIKTYFPMPGDSEAVISQKKAARAQATAGMRQMGGRAASPTETPPSSGNRIRFDAQGNRIGN